MRIAVTSDIHFHPPWYDRIKRFADLLQEQKPDLLVLAGDIGEPVEMFTRGLKVFQPVCEQRAALAGNHDVWHRDSSYTSQELWESRLEETARELGYHWLDRENVVIGSIGICGSIAWYDYSGKHPEINLTDDEYEMLKPLITNDGRYVDWPWTDREFARRVTAEICARLDALESDPRITDIVALTHVPIFSGPQSQALSPANAYYANLALGEAVRQYEKVRVVLSGHVHLGLEREIPRGNLPPMRAYTNPADYGQPAALLVETETWQVTPLRGE